METKLYCIGCGSELQTEEQSEIGYIPQSALQKDQLLCQRCFKLRHYNTNEPVALDSDDFMNMIRQIRHTNSLIVHVIDLFDVNGTLLHRLPSMVGNNPILLIGNKLDLLPKSTNIRRLKNWLRRMAKDAGLHISGVFLISAAKGHYMDELAAAMEEMRKQQDIYVVGVTNVGKSTFINQFISRSIGEKNTITTSYFPGTTLGFIEIPLDSQSALIDTPGVINKEQIAHYVSKQDLKVITPNKEIKARNYQLNDDQTLFIGGLVRIDFLKGDRQTFVCYFSNELSIHRTKLEKADTLYDNQAGKLLNPPNEETLHRLPRFEKSTIHITAPYTDIVISGLGWVTVVKGGITLDIHHPKGVAVVQRKSIISKQ